MRRTRSCATRLLLCFAADRTVAHVHVGYGEDMLDSLVAEINGLLGETPPASAAVATN